MRRAALGVVGGAVRHVAGGVRAAAATRWSSAKAPSGPEGPTIFGSIIRRDLPATVVYEDDDVLAFHDIAPTAPVHILVIPKRCIPGVSHAEEADRDTLGALLLGAKKVAEKVGIDKTGYRLVVNDGGHGCQTVDHIHVHVIGGKQLTWPPGC